MLKQTVVAMRDLPRMKEIIGILMRYGLGDFIQRLKLSNAFSFLNKDGAQDNIANNPYLSVPQRFRMACE